jgi:hypothetical protein
VPPKKKKKKKSYLIKKENAPLEESAPHFECGDQEMFLFLLLCILPCYTKSLSIFYPVTLKQILAKTFKKKRMHHLESKLGHLSHPLCPQCVSLSTL